MFTNIFNKIFNEFKYQFRKMIRSKTLLVIAGLLVASTGTSYAANCSDAQQDAADGDCDSNGAGCAAWCAVWGGVAYHVCDGGHHILGPNLNYTNTYNNMDGTLTVFVPDPDSKNKTDGTFFRFIANSDQGKTTVPIKR